MNKYPSVSIIIANYNGEKYLPTCLTSVLKTAYQDLEILVVDDGSTDESIIVIEEFKKNSTKIKLLRNRTNIGAAASRNKAAAEAEGEILVFLDNDTEVDKYWLSEIVDVLVKHSDVGGCQAKLMDYERRELIQVAGIKLWAATGWGLPIRSFIKDSRGFKEEEDTIALSAALGIWKEIFFKVNGFDEDEAVVTEDLDLSWRIWIRGYRVVVSPKSIVYHWTKQVSQRKNMKHTSSTIYYHLTKNSLISILKNYEGLNAMKYFFYSIAISLARSLAILLRKRDFSSVVGTMKGFLWVLLHMPRIFIKRQKVQKLRKRSDYDLFQSVILRDSPYTIYKKYFLQSGLL